MRKFLLLTFIAAFVNVSAQDIQLLDTSDNVVNGDTLSIVGVVEPSNPYNRIDFKYVTVKNNTSSSVEVRVLRKEGSMVQSGSADLLCWGGICENGVPAGQNPNRMSGLTEVMSSGESIVGGGSGFAGYYQPNGNSGDTYYSYTFFDVDSIVEPATFTVKFTAREPFGVGIQEHLKNQKLTLSPNPATSSFNLEYNLKGSYSQKTVEVLNIVGKTVMRQNLSSDQGVENLQVSNLQAGIYFVRINADGKYTASQKLIVR